MLQGPPELWPTVMSSERSDGRQKIKCGILKPKVRRAFETDDKDTLDVKDKSSIYRFKETGG